MSIKKVQEKNIKLSFEENCMNLKNQNYSSMKLALFLNKKEKERQMDEPSVVLKIDSSKVDKIKKNNEKKLNLNEGEFLGIKKKEKITDIVFKFQDFKIKTDVQFEQKVRKEIGKFIQIFEENYFKIPSRLLAEIDKMQVNFIKKHVKCVDSCIHLGDLTCRMKQYLIDSSPLILNSRSVLNNNEEHHRFIWDN